MSKVLDVRLKHFEQKLTIPNITREMFRGSKLEYIAPIAATYIDSKLKSGKTLLELIGGFFAGFTSIFSAIKLRKKNAAPAKNNKQSKPRKSSYNEEEMFI